MRIRDDVLSADAINVATILADAGAFMLSSALVLERRAACVVGIMLQVADSEMSFEQK